MAPGHKSSCCNSSRAVCVSTAQQEDGLYISALSVLAPGTCLRSAWSRCHAFCCVLCPCPLTWHSSGGREDHCCPWENVGVAPHTRWLERAWGQGFDCQWSPPSHPSTLVCVWTQCQIPSLPLRLVNGEELLMERERLRVSVLGSRSAPVLLSNNNNYNDEFIC